MLRRMILISTISWIAVSATASLSQEYYYDLQTAYEVVRVASKIAVQFDPAIPQQQMSQFYTAHPCLDPAFEVRPLHRGFRVYGTQLACGYSVAAADLLADASVKAVVPVYMTPGDSAEFRVTDLIDVQFIDNLPVDSGLAILTAYGLHFVDSNEYRHNLWECALDVRYRTARCRMAMPYISCQKPSGPVRTSTPRRS